MSPGVGDKKAQLGDKGKKDPKGKGPSPPGSPLASDHQHSKKIDPNVNKIIPGVIHIGRDFVSSTSEMINLFQYVNQMKKEESTTILLEDN